MRMKKTISLILASVLCAASFLSATAAPKNSTTTTTDAAVSGTTNNTIATAAPTAEPVKETEQPVLDVQTEDIAPAQEPAELDPAIKASGDIGANMDIAYSSGNGSVYLEDESMGEPDVRYAQAALLMDLNSGRLLYGKNIDQKLYPASTTKIMTGILAIELCQDMNEVITAPYEAIAPITLEDSHMGILTGEELTFEQLLTGMLVYSANDAANVLAIHLAGSMDAFVAMMNQKAQELGMTNTHFANSCGTHDDNHYTTARDLAIISQYAMHNETFREIVKMPIYKIAPTNKYTSERILVNTNLFLSTSRSMSHYYPPCTGIKTGHTSQAGYCLVSSAQYNDIQLLAITLNCPNEDVKDKAYSYIDSRTLFDFGFDNYVNQVIASPGDVVSDSKVAEAKNNTRVALTVEAQVNALVPANVDSSADIIPSINIPDTLNAPIKKGDVLGSVTYTYKGTQIGTSNLIATNDVERNNLIHALNIVIKIITSPFFFIPVIILIILLMVANNKKKKRERQKRIQSLRRSKQQKSPDRSASRTARIQEEARGSNSRYTNNEE
ncbi:MAG: D-alanyl-D-alanine carboxypeptidase [Clostridiales bacterium]|nr:D-alanyl-D-alanine carboxypeptidase [Clostridiales bacterium]